MRLIDADKIVFTNCLVKSGLRVCCHNEGIVPKESIEMQPIVNAIPIEWINDYIDSTLDEGNSQMLGFKASIIKEMLEKWEKENDRQRNFRQRLS